MLIATCLCYVYLLTFGTHCYSFEILYLFLIIVTGSSGPFIRKRALRGFLFRGRHHHSSSCELASSSSPAVISDYSWTTATG